MASRLSATGLAKRYKQRAVVKNVTLDVAAGEVVGLLGPNGAGKTTSFYMIVGLIPCDAGKIALDNVDITRQPLHTRATMGIGYLPQEASVFRKLSVADNIMAILEMRPTLTKVEREQKLEKLLNDLHIQTIRASLGMSLSGGERRRVEIARALAAEPAFILLDEPFAGVDPLSVVDIQSIVRHLKEQSIGVLITDHNVRETLGICDRAYIINNGEVIASGTSDQIMSNTLVREVYLGQDFRM